jgi:hypothetical protein
LGFYHITFRFFEIGLRQAERALKRKKATR